MCGRETIRLLHTYALLSRYYPPCQAMSDCCLVSHDMLCHNFPSTILPPKLGALKLPTSKVPFSIPWVDSDHHCAPLSGFCGRVDAPRRLLFGALEMNGIDMAAHGF